MTNESNYTNSPIVSVIIPLFNAEKYIASTIESVLKQTYQDYEIIIVDDSSTDNSLKIARDFAARYPEKITVLQHANNANRGVAASRNLAVSKAKGKYVAFLDADDIWFPEKLDRQVRFMRDRPDIKLSYTQSAIHREGIGKEFVPDEDILGTRLPPDPKIVLFQIILVQVNFGFSTVMVETNAIRAAGCFDEHLPFQSEDRIMVAKISACHPVAFLPETLCEYRAHDASYTATVITGRLPPAIFYDVQVRVMKWMVRNNIHKDWAGEIAHKILPMSVVRACACTMNVRVLCVIFGDFITSLFYFPVIPFLMIGRLFCFLKGGKIFSRGMFYMRKTAVYRKLFKQKETKATKEGEL